VVRPSRLYLTSGNFAIFGRNVQAGRPLSRAAHTVSVYEDHHDIWMRRNGRNYGGVLRTLKSNYFIIYNDIEISEVID